MVKNGVLCKIRMNVKHLIMFETTFTEKIYVLYLGIFQNVSAKKNLVFIKN